jgi:hypothetical protein
LHSSVGAGAAPLRARAQSRPMDHFFLIICFYHDQPRHTSHNATQRAPPNEQCFAFRIG